MRRHILAASVGFLGVLCGLELLLRFLPVPEGISAADARANWPIRTLTPHQRYTHSTGWHLGNVRHGTTNDYGYVSPFDYQGRTNGVALFGDSFVESLMNDYGEAISGSLGKQLNPSTPVMNFGVSGASMPHYLGSAPLIANRFQPDWAVVVIGLNDFSSGFHVGPGRYRWARRKVRAVELVPERTASNTAKFIRSLALVRYVRGSLKINKHTLFASRPTAPDEQRVCRDSRLNVDDMALLEAFADGFAPALSLSPSRVVLVFDTDRKSIYRKPKSGSACIRRDDLANRTLVRLARARGYRVIEMRPVFNSYYARTGRQVDYLPEDGHWNAVGHELAAREVARVIHGRNVRRIAGAYANEAKSAKKPRLRTHKKSATT